jgi:hypothetical protein
MRLAKFLLTLSLLAVILYITRDNKQIFNREDLAICIVWSYTVGNLVGTKKEGKV